MTSICCACKRISGSKICSSCAGLNSKLSRVQIVPYPYSFKPALQRMASPTEISLGVELEYESQHPDSCREITAATNKDLFFLYIKRDGSLSSRCAGEMVTVPASLDVHRHMWTSYFFNQGSASRRFSITTRPRTCGLHIHIGREQLSKSQIAKIFAFLNYKYNEEFVFSIAGRRYSSYAMTIGHPKYTYGVYWCLRKHCHGGDRYSALNLLPSETVEVRIFKATLAPWRLFARLEFAHALATACAPGNGLRNCIHYENFVKWVASKKEDYPYLCKYLASKNLLVN